MSLWQTLLDDGPRRGGRLHCWDGERFDVAPWTDVVADARRTTAGLRELGLGPGTVVATVLTNTPQTVRGILGAWLTGAVIASLPVPARGMDLAEYGDQIVGLAEHAGAEAIVVDPRMRALVPGALADRVPVGDWESVADGDDAGATPAADDDPCFVQYSSGSTGTPKGCVLTPRAVAAQLDLLADLLEAEPGRDAVASWMPLSHDMGIFGNLLTPWSLGIDLVLSSPERFLMSPRTWFADTAEHGATITTGTSTALHIGSRATARQPPSRPLDVHTCIIGAEPIDAAVFDRACETLAPLGFTPSSLTPAYGLAEATLAVTALPRRREPSTLRVDPIALAAGTVEAVEDPARAGTTVVGCGPPCTGVALDGLEEGRVSEVVVRSASLADGYHRDPERTAERFADGAVRSGDLGFLHAGELHLVGRLDDLLTVAGRNVHAGDVESDVERIPGVRPGGVNVVALDGGGSRPEIVLVAEVRDEASDHRGIADEASERVLRRVGVAVDRCVLLPRGQLPKTPSGKHQRHRCRAFLHEGRFEPVADIALGSGARR